MSVTVVKSGSMTEHKYTDTVRYFDGYTLNNRNRLGRSGGGVCIFVDSWYSLNTVYMMVNISLSASSLVPQTLPLTLSRLN